MNIQEALKDLFDDKRRPYFEKLAGKVMPAIEMHKKFDLLDDPKWRNVSEHCLMEAARVEIIAGLIGLSQDIIKDLVTTSALHDFYKKYEIGAIQEELKSGGNGWGAIYKTADERNRHIKEANFNDRVKRLVNASGGNPETLFKAKKILDQSNITEEDWAFLFVYYVDSYTRGSNWAETADNLNDVDRRLDKNASNPNYSKQNFNVKKFDDDPLFRGKSIFQAMKEISHMIEKRLCVLIKDKTGIMINSLELPEFIDSEIMSIIIKLRERETL